MPCLRIRICFVTASGTRRPAEHDEQRALDKRLACRRSRVLGGVANYGLTPRATKCFNFDRHVNAATGPFRQSALMHAFAHLSARFALHAPRKYCMAYVRIVEANSLPGRGAQPASSPQTRLQQCAYTAPMDAQRLRKKNPPIKKSTNFRQWVSNRTVQYFWRISANLVMYPCGLPLGTCHAFVMPVSRR